MARYEFIKAKTLGVGQSICFELIYSILYTYNIYANISLLYINFTVKLEAYWI